MWPFQRKTQSRQVVQVAVKGRFDAAGSGDDNRNHWASVDNLSADAAASSAVRQTLRNRSRYEVANNSYARGMLVTLANDAIGTGPRLQMAGKAKAANHRIEQAFQAWSRTIDLPGKLRTARMAISQDGEAFLQIVRNPANGAATALDVRLIEADRIASPYISQATGMGTEPVDGIKFDTFGNPRSYHVLDAHPGANAILAGSKGRDVAAKDIMHLFRADRAGQHRGLPEIMPALPLFAQLRRYTLAVLTSAETAANHAVLMETDAPAGGQAAEVDAGIEMEMTRNMAMFMPEGWTVKQLKPEQPTTTYLMFRDGILNEIARCLNMPFNVAAGNSAGYNYASGRLDHQVYFKSIRVMQSSIESAIMDRLFAAWIGEAAMLLGLSPDAMAQVEHQWIWDGTEHVDPAKEASAQAARLASNTTTLAVEYARQGKDWETELRQRAVEKNLMDELGLSAAQAEPIQKTKTEDEEEIANERSEQ